MVKAYTDPASIINQSNLYQTSVKIYTPSSHTLIAMQQCYSVCLIDGVYTKMYAARNRLC